MRASLPTPDSGWKQRRITTAFPSCSAVGQARQLAEELDRDLELHRRGLEAFPLERRLQPAPTTGEDSAGISGQEAVSRTEAWWRQAEVTLATLRAVVERRTIGSCGRSKAALAAVAQALDMGSEGAAVDRSAQLAGFVKELYSWDNLLDAHGLRFSGSRTI